MSESRRVLPSFLLVLGAFAVGVMAERYGWIGTPARTGPPFGKLREAYDLVQEHFIDRARVREDRLEQGAIRGMIDTLGDRGHTFYMTAEEVRQAAEDRAGKASGIGVRVAMVRDKPTLLEIFPDSPASKADLRRGDVVASINGEKPRSLYGVTSKLRGPTGSTIRLGLDRLGKTLDVSLERAEVLSVEVLAQVLPTTPAIGYLAIRQFHRTCAAETADAMAVVTKTPLAGLILDLRGNMGGLKSQGVGVAELFLPKERPILIEKATREAAVTLRAGDVKRRWTDIPMIVLIDGQTASTSEVVAAALRENDRARLVGTRTYGTGTMLREYPLSDGSAIRLAIKTWRTPTGKLLWYRGMDPDVVSALSAKGRLHVPDPAHPLSAKQLAACEDNQLLRAILELRKKLE